MRMLLCPTLQVRGQVEGQWVGREAKPTNFNSDYSSLLKTYYKDTIISLHD